MGHFTLKPDSQVLWQAENPAIGAMIRHWKRTSRRAKGTIGRPKKRTGIENGRFGAAPGGFRAVKTGIFRTVVGFTHQPGR
jgi:hypothetical protein